MALLYMSCSFLSAIKGENEGRLASILKKEAIKQINHMVKDPRTAYTSETVSAIGFLSAGNWVCTNLKMWNGPAFHFSNNK